MRLHLICSAMFMVVCGQSDPEEPPNGADSDSEVEVDSDTAVRMAPWVTLLRPAGDGTWYADQPIVFEAVVVDEDTAFEDLELMWSSSLDGDLTAVDGYLSADGYASGLGFLSEGEHLITVTVTDSHDNTGSDESTIVVGPANRAPVCEIVSPGEGTVHSEGSLIFIRVAADDPDSGPTSLSATLSSDQMGLLGAVSMTSGGDGSFSADLTTANHLLTLSVEDEFGQSCAATRSLTVSPP